MAEEESNNGAEAQDTDGGRQLLGPILALLLTLLIGAGLGALVLRMFQDPAAEEPGAQGDEQQAEDRLEADQARLFVNTEAMIFDDVITNLKGELSRYIKVRVHVWFDRNDPDYQRISSDQRVKHLLQEQMIEELRSYDQKQLADDFVLEQMKKGFTDKMDRELRRFLGAGSDRTYVEKVVISDFILQ